MQITYRGNNQSYDPTMLQYNLYTELHVLLIVNINLI